MNGRTPPSLTTKMTGAEFIAYIIEDVVQEARFTESVNERKELRDYIADLDYYLARKLAGEVEL